LGVNGTEKLAFEEITAILTSVGLRWTPHEAREMMSEAGGPNDGNYPFPATPHTHQEEEDQTIEQAFRIIEMDGGGKISVDDRQCFMLSLGVDFDPKYAERRTIEQALSLMLKAATGEKVARQVKFRTAKGLWRANGQMPRIILNCHISSSQFRFSLVLHQTESLLPEIDDLCLTDPHHGLHRATEPNLIGDIATLLSQ
jgi:Ca2+-binding EF-hand superfamily protein